MTGGRSVRVTPNRRPRTATTEPASSALPRYAVWPSVTDDDGRAFTLGERASGQKVAHFAHAGDAHRLADLLNALDGGAWPEDVLLGDGEHRRLLRRLDALRSPAVCFRCGRTLEVGSPAYWHVISKAIRHVGSCSKAELASKRSPRARRRRSA